MSFRTPMVFVGVRNLFEHMYVLIQISRCARNDKNISFNNHSKRLTSHDVIVLR